MTIALLADYPQHLPTLAGWIYDEWHRHRHGETLATTVAMLRTMLRRDAIPLTLIALDDAVPVGTASLYLHDIPERPELSPWLAAVYVIPARRHAGIGAQLVRAAEAAARDLGVARLHLFTPDREAFYTYLGWHTVEQTHYDGHAVVIMATSL
ncbi:MAG TPA: GNAT family N-acetyltransferase [Roseiflexaceae bacterium]|nr:GNAT family N-acetyltransferase [Roseiflexaceae bacterium]HMP43132.1 GNAT family N-acetyltransferase [Roseiflexaceae bacterium]